MFSCITHVAWLAWEHLEVLQGQVAVKRSVWASDQAAAPVIRLWSKLLCDGWMDVTSHLLLVCNCISSIGAPA